MNNMTKEQIKNKILSLKTDEEIESFIKERLNELENNSIESTVGQGYTSRFREYISSKTHYKVGADLSSEIECPDLVYDDLEPYINIIKSIQKAGGYNEFDIIHLIFVYIFNHLIDEDMIERLVLYNMSSNQKVSIKEVKENKCAFCSEKSGQVHNLFKFLGLDSEVASGYRDNERHAYNIYYPYGYDGDIIMLYDASHYVEFKKGDNSFVLAYFKAFKKESFQKLLDGQRISIDLATTERTYRKLFNLDESYIFNGKQVTYTLEVISKKRGNKIGGR